MRSITIRFEKELYEKMQKQAEKERRSINGLVNVLVENHIKNVSNNKL